MGFNISGLAINKNFEAEFENLQKELGWTLEKEADINFETASSNWKDDGICDVYFTDNGTLLFISMDMCADSWSLKSNKTLTFVLSETSMAFNISYCENGVEKRSIMEVEDNRMTDEGSKLEVESKSEDASEIIWNQLEVILGKRFWDIDPEEKAVRYVFVKNKITTEKSEHKQVSLDKSISKDPESSRIKINKKGNSNQLESIVNTYSSKKWWEFWK